MASFSSHNPGLRRRLFDQSTAASFIAEHLSARNVEAFAACAAPTGQADYFRYCAAYVEGGLCIDADVRCLGDIGALFDRPRGIVFGQRDPLPRRIEGLPPWPYRVGPYETLINGIFAFAQPADPFLALAIEVATANIEHRVADGPRGVWLTTGPGVFTSLYLLHGLGSIDAFMRYSVGTIVEPSASLFCEVVESADRVERAFDGLDTAAVEDLHGSLEHVGIPRSGDGVSHWSQSPGSIFR